MGKRAKVLRAIRRATWRKELEAEEDAYDEAMELAYLTDHGVDLFDDTQPLPVVPKNPLMYVPPKPYVPEYYDFIPTVSGSIDGAQYEVPIPAHGDRFPVPDRKLPKLDSLDVPGTKWRWSSRTGVWTRVVPLCDIGRKSELLVGRAQIVGLEADDAVRKVLVLARRPGVTDDQMHVALDDAIATVNGMLETRDE